MPAAKKPTPKKTPTSKTEVKKPPAKRVQKKPQSAQTRNVVKKVSKAKAPRKSVAKKASTIATERLQNPKRAKKPHAKRQSSKSTEKETHKTVTVPSNVPLRSIEKAEMFRSELSLYWQKSIGRIAIISGFCFLLLGATLSSVSVFALSPAVNNNAQITSAVTDPIISQLDVYTSLTDVLSEPTRVLFTITNVSPESIKYYLIQYDTQDILYESSPEKLEGGKYQFLLSPEHIPAGHYNLYIKYRKLNNEPGGVGALVTESVAQFESQLVQDTTTGTHEDTLTDENQHTTSTDQTDGTTNYDTSPDSTNTDAVDSSESEIDLEEANATATSSESGADSTTAQTDDSTDILNPVVNTVEPVIKEDEVVVEKTVKETMSESDETVESIKEPVLDDTIEPIKEVVKTEEPKLQPFFLLTTESTVSGIVTIPFEATDLHELELYARPVTSLNSRFLTRAVQRSGKTVFVLNTEAFLPNGTYEVYATAINPNQRKRTTPSVLLKVNNVTAARTPVLVNQSSTDGTSDVSGEDFDSAAEQQKNQDTLREFAPIPLTERTTDDDLQTDIQDASDRLLSEDAEAITQLLQNYASARQSGDEILQRAAKEALTQKGTELANDALVDTELAGISDDVIRTLSEKVEDLQNRIDTFEQIRTEKSAGQSAFDSDDDGIPDFDEINLYGTDPNNPDTDGDGFVDGIEIVRGFDPLDSTAQAVVVYESPKESIGLVQSSVLEVKEVIPSLNAIDNTSDKMVRAQIRGKGLPNSFVTLYIFSTPTIVTIKTDADGSFVYTLDKELEDGTHDVFVALTDNTGSIVAQSNPFSFIKEAQAFTPVDAAGSDQIGTDSVVQSVSANSYNTVIGVGVLAFGLILLMLGISLRTKYEEDILITDRLSNESVSNTSSAKITA
jgi:hypothetical protein